MNDNIVRPKRNLQLRKIQNQYMIVEASAANVNMSNVYSLNKTAADLWEITLRGGGGHGSDATLSSPLLAGAALALMLLGQAFTPPQDKLPLRQWTPVYLMDRVGQGFRALWMISQARADRVDNVRRELMTQEQRDAEDERRRRRPDASEEPEEPGGR